MSGRYGGHEMKWVGDATGAQLVGPCSDSSGQEMGTKAREGTSYTVSTSSHLFLSP